MPRWINEKEINKISKKIQQFLSEVGGKKKKHKNNMDSIIISFDKLKSLSDLSIIDLYTVYNANQLQDNNLGEKKVATVSDPLLQINTAVNGVKQGINSILSNKKNISQEVNKLSLEIYELLRFLIKSFNESLVSSKIIGLERKLEINLGDESLSLKTELSYKNREIDFLKEENDRKDKIIASKENLIELQKKRIDLKYKRIAQLEALIKNENLEEDDTIDSDSLMFKELLNINPVDEGSNDLDGFCLNLS
ncbi:hypothetical protein PsalN5692_03983 (plasmid) [Piscirickettsia salmonis]|uniref:hypothetical protein n=1 Tax=Piscirickettsia salmonis TaxID=1238 RepID=UPI0012BA2B5A|nr:hypothetical protein [Piscirickettsia salmonis]QGP52474.1 hypothetical protein PsalN5692_03983 [Piscirickettsia salmonis]